MKLQFKKQQYQLDAVNSVADAFLGQPRNDGTAYRIDPGVWKDGQIRIAQGDTMGLRNAEILLTQNQLVENVQKIQRQGGLEESQGLKDSIAAPEVPNFDIEMETGTGKTFVYIKTIMELNRRYGWSKFIIVVPSIAIREGVKKTFEVTAEHFKQEYGTSPRAFVYNSSRLNEIEAFSENTGVQVMIINIQAFNSTGKDNRRIYEELDDFGSRRPIDVIAANRPIVIIDEPQKMSAKKSLKSLAEFKALMMLRYSATHKDEHTKVYRLDAVDAYNQQLVKRIGVRGITVKGLAGTEAYLYVENIEVSQSKPPFARVEMEVQTKTGIRRQRKRLLKGDNLHELSNGIEAYKGLFVVDIDATADVVRLSNGDDVFAGQLADRDVTEETKRRIQIREVVKAHLDKERELYPKGIKVLSLFFIDEVAKYRDYSREDTMGEYARVFEEEYTMARDALFDELELEKDFSDYLKYVSRDEVHAVHQGYFSVDKKSKQAVDGKVSRRGDDKGQSTDSDAYDLILRDKERLLSLDEPVRFIFSHSALREGWDNPNVFTMGMLKKSDNTVSRRQEIGRGLRLCVNQEGERQDSASVMGRVHDINVLTVVTDESYTEFVDGLQKEIAESLSFRPREASVDYFIGQAISIASGEKLKVTEKQAKVMFKYLLKNEYIDDDWHVTQAFKEGRREGGHLEVPPDSIVEDEFKAMLPLVDALYMNVPKPRDDRKAKRLLPNANLKRKEFQELWKRINHKAVYTVDFDSSELIEKAIRALNRDLHVTSMQYTVEVGTQNFRLKQDDLEKREGFGNRTSERQSEFVTAASSVKYDLIGEVAEKTMLTRRTCAAILKGIGAETFAMYRLNPEHFIMEVSRIVNEQKATEVIEHLSYSLLESEFDTSIFTANQTRQVLGENDKKLQKHIYDYAVTDSLTEQAFLKELEEQADVVVYAKLPGGFFIPTPLGNYNPDWAIAFTEDSVKHVYFVAETKGSMSSLQLKGAELGKIECARKFFAKLNSTENNDIRYDVVSTYDDLLTMVTA